MNPTSADGQVRVNDYLDIGCYGNYSGNWAPTVHCSPNVTDGNVAHVAIQSERIKYTFRQRIQALENMTNINLTCATFFATSGFHPVNITGGALSRTRAANIPYYTFVWTSVIPVLCKYKNKVFTMCDFTYDSGCFILLVNRCGVMTK